MLGSVHSHQDPQELHLRHLLDQRAARADLHSPLSISEFPDSPSVYSHPYFSPRQEYRDETDTSSTFSVPRSRSSSASGLSSSLSSRDILNNTAASILDLEDDTNSSIVSQTAYDEDDESTQEALGDDESHNSRMSMLGPKMRFHSRAPWETGEDTLQEEDEVQEQRPSTSSFRRVRSKASTGEAIMKGLGLGTSNLRSSNASRPSSESSRSQSKPKRSFESTISNSRSALRRVTLIQLQRFFQLTARL
jgi:hypothetical protein